MTKAETARLLALIAAFDKRTVGETEIEAWHLIIGHLDPQDCAEAVRQHFTDSTAYLMPAHIVKAATLAGERREGRRRVAELEAQRLAEQRQIEAAPVEPVNREEVKAHLKAMAARGKPLGRAADPRRDARRMAEARAELDALRVVSSASPSTGNQQ
jgi:hypothetical protein